MVAQYVNLTQHDAVAGQNAPVDYGPATVTAGFTITRIRVTGGIAVPVQTTTAGITIDTWLQYGIQHGTIGYIPAHAETQPTPGTQWLDFRMVKPTSSELVTAHGTPGSDVSVRYNLDIEWRGQFYTPSGTDVYFSVGRSWNPGLNYYFQGSMVVTYG